MTEVQDSTDRAAKWMRYIARALTVIWAAELTLIAALAACFLGSAEFPVGIVVGHDVKGGWAAEFPVGIVAGLFLVLAAWASVAIPWRWRREGAGGVVLVLEGLLVVLYLLATSRHPAALCVGLPLLLAGSLFLASWWRSRRAGIPQNTA